MRLGEDAPRPGVTVADSGPGPRGAPPTGVLGMPPVVPVLRGILHVHAAYVAAIVAVVLVATAPAGDSRAVAAAYGVALVALFGVSGLLHRWRGSTRWVPALRRLDHCTIFVFIATCESVIAVEVLDGATRTVVLAAAWGGAAAGIVLSIAWIDAPRGVASLSYVLVSCAAAGGLGQLADRLPFVALVLLGAGVVIYAIGAFVYATGRPDPWPRTFGYHEVFHALTIVAVALHLVAVAGWVLPYEGAS